MPPSTQAHQIPKQFNPAYSLLGRWIRRKTGEAYRAEALYMVVLTGLAVSLVLLQYLIWALVHPLIQPDPTGPVALVYWGAQLGSFTLCFLCCVLGYKPAFTVEWKAQHLEITQGGETLRLPLDEIFNARPITATLYHRHYRRYAATRSFLGPLEPELLLLETQQGPVVLPSVAGDGLGDGSLRSRDGFPWVTGMVR